MYRAFLEVAVKLLLERGADPNVKVVDPMSYGDDETKEEESSKKKSSGCSLVL